MKRKPRPAKERARLFELHGGLCHICGGKINVGEAWELEHVIPFEFAQDDTDENVKPAHVACHKVKTADDVKDIAKARRRREKHFGFRPPSKSPMPGSKASKWRRKMNGEVVPR